MTRIGQRDVLALTVRAKSDADSLMASVPVEGDAIDLEIRADGGRMDFFYTVGGVRRELRAGVDATFLSTSKAGGFTGTIIGPYVWRAGARGADSAY